MTFKNVNRAQTNGDPIDENFQKCDNHHTKNIGLISHIQSEKSQYFHVHFEVSHTLENTVTFQVVSVN